MNVAVVDDSKEDADQLYGYISRYAARSCSRSLEEKCYLIAVNSKKS